MLIATSQSACVHITVHLRKSMPFTNKQIVEFYFETSNIAEQLFSSARHIFSDNRKKMTPVNLEAILFLKANKKLWDAQVVKQATEKISEDQQ